MSATRRLRRRRGRSHALVLCARVGRARRVPPGTQLRDCYVCKHPVWITPASIDAVGDLVLVPLCDDCLEGPAR